MSRGERDVWAEAERSAAQWFARSGAGPSTPETEWMDRFAVATAAAQAFAERCRRCGERLSEADARRLAIGLRECLRDGPEFNPATTFDEAIERALDPKRKDRVRYRDMLDARFGEYVNEGRPIPTALRRWWNVGESGPKNPREAPNFTRDGWVVRTLMVLDDCGIKPTRNRSNQDEQGYLDKPRLSGCAIVAAVLDDLKESGVEAVWSRRKSVQ